MKKKGIIVKTLVKYSNAEYFMPFLFCNDIFIPVLDKLLEKETNPVKYVYGSPYCKWGNGARPSVFKLNNLSFIENYLNKLINKYNVIPAFTFTSLNAKEALNDEYSNNLLDIAYKFNSRFIVSTDELYNHIKSRYPDAKMHCSVIHPAVKFSEEKNFDETKFYNKMLDKYEVVVIRPEYAVENTDKLDKLLADISRTEVLINQYCHYNCPFHKNHYNFLAQIDECFGNIEKMKKVKYYSDTEGGHEHFSLCPKFKPEYKSVYLTDEQVQTIVEAGVRKLKLQGRSLNFNMLFRELYNSFFNKEYSKEELRNKIDKICAGMIEKNKRLGLILS